MISLALSYSKPSSSPEIAEATAQPVDGAQPDSAFSAIFLALGKQMQPGDGETEASADEVTEPSAIGIVLPVPADTGKILPEIAAITPSATPAKGGEEIETDADVVADGANAGSATIDAALVQLTATAGAPAVPERTEAIPEAIAKASSPAATADDLPSSFSAIPAPVKRESGDRAAPAAVALHVAPEAEASRSGARGNETAAETPPGKASEAAVERTILSKAGLAEPAPQAPSAQLAPALQAEAAPAGRPHEGLKPAVQSDPLQDLARVVDRLAAAREMFAPAAAALAVKHAEFGDLSLRFDQQRDGQLAVQLSASDPEAHRAVAAAVGERSGANMADSHAGGGQAQAQGRAAADRDGTGDKPANGNSARQDQPQQGRPARKDAQPGSGNPQSGIFA